MPQSEPQPVFDPGTAEPSWKAFYQVGGTTALLALAVALVEIGITFQAGTGVPSPPHGTVSVLDWFALFQNDWFLGLRNLGLLNLIGAALLVSPDVSRPLRRSQAANTQALPPMRRDPSKSRLGKRCSCWEKAVWNCPGRFCRPANVCSHAAR